MSSHKDSRHADLPQDVQGWRTESLSWLLDWIAWLALPALAVGAYGFYTAGAYGWIGLIVVAYMLLLVGTLERVPHTARAVGLLLATAFAGLLSLAHRGWIGWAALFAMSAALLAVLFLGKRASLIVVGVGCAVLLAFGLALSFGLLAPVDRGASLLTWPDVLGSVAVFAGVTLLLVVVLDRLMHRWARAARTAADLTARLETERRSAAERMRAVQDVNALLQRRTMYLEGTVEVTRSLSTVFELEPLLERAVNGITQQFDFYHAAIFLLDEDGEWAILRAASSTAGRRMLARGHRLRRGSDSMVGWVVEHREARLALDVEADAAYFANPDLPATSSALTLPLMVGDRLIGVLDVQSTEANAFDQDDLRVLQSLAHQLALAIHNADRLSDEASALEAASPYYRLARRLADTHTEAEVYETLLEALQPFNASRALLCRLREAASGEGPMVVGDLQRGQVSFEQRDLFEDAVLRDVVTYGLMLETQAFIEDLNAPYDTVAPGIKETLGYLAEHSDVRSVALVPLRGAEGPLGVLLVTYTTPHRYGSLEQRFYRVLSDLGAVALEHARLLDEAQVRAEREELTAELAARMRETLDMDLVLQTALREIGERLGIADIEVRMADRAVATERRDV